MSRINLRMPEQLRTRIEAAAAAAGLSVNAWLVRAAAAAADRPGPQPSRAGRHARVSALHGMGALAGDRPRRRHEGKDCNADVRHT